MNFSPISGGSLISSAFMAYPIGISSNRSFGMTRLISEVIKDLVGA
jgi:hypothetical protein